MHAIISMYRSKLYWAIVKMGRSWEGKRNRGFFLVRVPVTAHEDGVLSIIEGMMMHVVWSREEWLVYTFSSAHASISAIECMHWPTITCMTEKKNKRTNIHTASTCYIRTHQLHVRAKACASQVYILHEWERVYTANSHLSLFLSLYYSSWGWMCVCECGQFAFNMLFFLEGFLCCLNWEAHNCLRFLA